MYAREDVLHIKVVSRKGEEGEIEPSRLHFYPTYSYIRTPSPPFADPLPLSSALLRVSPILTCSTVGFILLPSLLNITPVLPEKQAESDIFKYVFEDCQLKSPIQKTSVV